MSKLLELREKRAKAWDAAKAFLDSKRGGDGLVSAEDNATYEKMEADVVALGKEVARLERQAVIDLEMASATSAPITGRPVTTGGVEKTGRASDEYRRDFVGAMRGRPATNVLSVGVDPDGGYLVPTEFETQIVKGLEEANVVRSIAKVISTNVERKIAIAASGSTAVWTAENGSIPVSDVTFGQKTLDAFKLTDQIKVSNELLQDSMFSIEAYLAEEFSRALGVAEEEAFCVGNGTGQPTGIFTANGGTVGTTANSGSAITFDDIVSLIHALKSPYRRNAVFLTHDTTVSAMRKLKDNNGAYLWQPSLQAGQPDRLFGYPLYTSPYAPVIASGAMPIAFGDFSHYWIADRQGRTIQRLNELYAGNGQIGFIITERLDAKVIFAEGIQLLKMAAA